MLLSRPLTTPPDCQRRSPDRYGTESTSREIGTVVPLEATGTGCEHVEADNGLRLAPMSTVRPDA